MRRDVMGNVDEAGIGAQTQDDRFHRAGVMVAGTEVGQQRNDRA
jgi:hypothetical protein